MSTGTYDDTGDPLASLGMQIAPIWGMSYFGKKWDFKSRPIGDRGMRKLSRLTGIGRKNLMSMSSEDLTEKMTKRLGEDLGRRTSLRVYTAQQIDRTTRALNIAGAKGTGVTTRAGWSAAKSAGVKQQFAKIGAGKAARLGYKVLMAGWKIDLAYQMGKGTVNYLREAGRKGGKLEMGNKPFMSTQAAYTERQRAVQAITSSRMSTRSAIGGEAALLHR